MVSRARNWGKMGGIYSFREKGGRAGVADSEPLFEGGLSGAEGVHGNPVRARPRRALFGRICRGVVHEGERSGTLWHARKQMS